MCIGKEVYMITYIHTSPNNFHKRQTIRNTWGDKRLLDQHKTKLVFVMGQVEAYGHYNLFYSHYSLFYSHQIIVL